MEFPERETTSQATSLEKELADTLVVIEKEKIDKIEAEELRKDRQAEEGADMVEGNNTLNKRVWNSGRYSAGLREIENSNQQKADALRERISSNEQALIRIKEMIETLKLNNKSIDVVSSYEERVILAEEELVKQRDYLIELEQKGNEIKEVNQKLKFEQEKIAQNPVSFAAEAMVGANEIIGEETTDKKETEERINAKLKARENEKEIAAQEIRDMEVMNGYEQLLLTVEQEFHQLQAELAAEKSKWESDINSSETAEKVSFFKNEIEKNLKGGFMLKFKSLNDKRTEIEAGLKGLEDIEVDFRRRSIETANKLRNFRSRTVENSVNGADFVKSLVSISKHMISNNGNNSEIKARMDSIEEKKNKLMLEIKNTDAAVYDLSDDFYAKIISEDEKTAYEKKMRELK